MSVYAALSLRWYDPDQVCGSTISSQPIGLPVVISHILSYHQTFGNHDVRRHMMDDTIFRAILVLFIPTLLLTALNIRIVKDNHQAVIERLGVFYRIVGPGVHVLIPFYERMVEVVPTTPLEHPFDHVIITTIIKDLKVYCYASRADFNMTMTTLLETCYPMPDDPRETLLKDEIDARITSYMNSLGLEITKIFFNNRL